MYNMEHGGVDAVKANDTIEAQSERVMSVSQALRNQIEDFLESEKIGETKGNTVAIPAPKLDAIAQISDNLTVAEQALKSAADYFERLKARIR